MKTFGRRMVRWMRRNNGDNGTAVVFLAIAVFVFVALVWHQNAYGSEPVPVRTKAGSVVGSGLMIGSGVVFSGHVADRIDMRHVQPVCRGQRYDVAFFGRPSRPSCSRDFRMSRASGRLVWYDQQAVRRVSRIRNRWSSDVLQAGSSGAPVLDRFGRLQGILRGRLKSNRRVAVLVSCQNVVKEWDRCYGN